MTQQDLIRDGAGPVAWAAHRAPVPDFSPGGWNGGAVQAAEMRFQPGNRGLVSRLAPTSESRRKDIKDNMRTLKGLRGDFFPQSVKPYPYTSFLER